MGHEGNCARPNIEFGFQFIAYNRQALDELFLVMDSSLFRVFHLIVLSLIFIHRMRTSGGRFYVAMRVVVSYLVICNNP